MKSSMDSWLRFSSSPICHDDDNSVCARPWFFHNGKQRGDKQLQGHPPRDGKVESWCHHDHDVLWSVWAMKPLSQVEEGVHGDIPQGHSGRDPLTNFCRSHFSGDSHHGITALFIWLSWWWPRRWLKSAISSSTYCWWQWKWEFPIVTSETDQQLPCYHHHGHIYCIIIIYFHSLYATALSW